MESDYQYSEDVIFFFLNGVTYLEFSYYKVFFLVSSYVSRIKINIFQFFTRTIFFRSLQIDF